VGRSCAKLQCVRFAKRLSEGALGWGFEYLVLLSSEGAVASYGDDDGASQMLVATILARMVGSVA
jgi:hypothetical protein